MLTYYIAVPVMLVAALFIGILLQKKKSTDVISRIIKISTIVFITFVMINFFLPDVLVRSWHDSFLQSLRDSGAGAHVILRWLNMASFIVIPLAVFQKNKYFQRIATYFCLPVAVINFIFTYKYIEYFCMQVYPDGAGLQTVPFFSDGFKSFLISEGFRLAFFGILCLSQLVVLSLLTVKNFKDLCFAKKEILNTVLITLGSVYIAMPIYALQYMFGIGDLVISNFSAIHLIWIFATIGLIVGFYFIFRKKSYDARHHFLIAVAWALMIQYSQVFNATGSLGMDTIPLQLCNLGAYLTLIMLITKNEKLFHFTLIVNVVGALIAFMVLDIGKGNIFYIWTVHFIVAHTKVLIIPILALALKIFKPIDRSMLKNFSIGFSLYFVAVFLVGTLSGIFYRIFADPLLPAGMETPYQTFFYFNGLYMFDKETANGLVGFTDPLFDTGKITMGPFEFSPLITVLIYVVFMALCIAIALLIYWLTRKQRRNAIDIPKL